MATKPEAISSTKPMTIEDIRRLIAAGVSVERLEGMIERLELDPDDEAALWLSAWSTGGRPSQRQPVPGLYLG